MDDVVLDFLADLYVAERVGEKTGETFLQFIARKERELAKGVSSDATYQSIRGVEVACGAKP